MAGRLRRGGTAPPQERRSEGPNCVAQILAIHRHVDGMGLLARWNPGSFLVIDESEVAARPVCDQIA